jgi:mannose-6-phosphate isomerase-like protein (cupin superfamily)
VHEHEADIFVVESGEATVVSGGAGVVAVFLGTLAVVGGLAMVRR